MIVKVAIEELRQAVAKSNGWPTHDRYPVDMLEILLLPPVWAWWSAHARLMGEDWEIQRIPGDMPPERGPADWTKCAGYVLRRKDGGMPWNSVRAEWYSHSPHNTFRGVCRYGPTAPLERLRTMAYEGTTGQFVFGDTVFVVTP